jgi:hypothetical protein
VTNHPNRNRTARAERIVDVHQTPCLSALASGDACQPDETLKRCAICGFVVDTMTSTVVHANDLDRARALLANDPDEMDEEWLAEIIAAVRAEATAAERERIARRVSEQQILRFQVGRDPLVEVNEFIQDLAYEIATDWEDYE